MITKHINPDLTLRGLPSLHAIRAFVAAAKHQSFTRAAESLCVTQAAISRQIKELEEEFKTNLFIRTGRSVTLTSAGIILFQTAEQSLDNISQATKKIRSSKTYKRPITLTCSSLFSRLFIIPRLPNFTHHNPDIKVRLVTTKNPFTPEQGGHPDFFITNRPTAFTDYISTPLAIDTIYPVCSPEYSKDTVHDGSVKSIKNCTLLSLLTRDQESTDEHMEWCTWLEHHNPNATLKLEEANNIITDDYSTLIDFAVNHQGVALGWNSQIASLIANGNLINPFTDLSNVHETKLYLAMKLDKINDKACLRLHLWLAEQFKAIEQKSLPPIS